MHFGKNWNNFGHNFGPYKILQNLNLYPVSDSSKLQLVTGINSRKKFRSFISEIYGIKIA